ncbi:type II toxin-antitoxin system VapC family toxin [Pendulispora brunnea]|uniref:Type II toxin-antitoxin system VapC family toxin n=1 Tax=Pendulispora brunnea TaxID=2905690 RepID=A0ABZ2KM72_9BACT
MKVLLDTHALLWALVDDQRRLSKAARDLLSDPEHRILVSAASAWEIGTKQRIGKLPPLPGDLASAIATAGFEPLAITMEHAELAVSLPGEHRDPFDRMLAAQARVEGVGIVSADEALDAFGVERLW